MAIFRSSSSLTRCDPNRYLNIYDVRSHPTLKTEPSGISEKKDTIDISKKKLEEDALKHLKKVAHKGKNNPIIPIVKYIFIAISFPPYLVLYRLPKMILSEAIPVVESSCQWIWKKLQNLAAKRIEAVYQIIARSTQYFKNVKKKLIQPFVNMASAIQKNIRRFRERIFQFIHRGVERAVSVFKAPQILMKAIINEGGRLIKKVKEKVLEQAKAVQEKVQEGIEILKATPQIIYGWGLAKIQNATQHMTSFRLRWKERVQSPQKSARSSANLIANACKGGIHAIFTPFRQLQKFLKEQIGPVWRTIDERDRKQWLKICDFFRQKHQRALWFLNEKNEKLKKLSSNWFLNMILSHPWIAKLPSYWQLWIKKLLSLPLAQAIIKGGVKLYAMAGMALISVAKAVLQIAAQGAVWAKESKAFLKGIAASSSELMVQYIKIGRSYLRKSAFYGLYFMLLIATMISISAIWGIRRLWQNMNALTTKLSKSR